MAPGVTCGESPTSLRGDIAGRVILRLVPNSQRIRRIRDLELVVAGVVSDCAVLVELAGCCCYSLPARA